MAQLLWGKVYYQDVFAGILRQEPGERYRFVYDESYINSRQPAISYSFPLRQEPYFSEYGLHPFFDNLVSEGWLENAQARVIRKRIWNRFELLLAFGADCAGAVSVVDPEPIKLTETSSDKFDPKLLAVLHARASLSGIQPKLALVKDKGKFRPSHIGEVSTYIGKFPSAQIPNIIEKEYLTTLACKKLLPEDDFVDLLITSVEGISDEALNIKRFDRTPDGKLIHFEEFNQLLKNPSRFKYDGAYKDIADFLTQAAEALPLDVVRLFKRIIMGILVGNTDMHLKNFGLIYTNQGMRLSPVYDFVAAAIYHSNFQSMALRIAGAQDLPIYVLKPKNILALSHEFSITKQMMRLVVEQFQKNIPSAQETLFSAPFGCISLKDQLIQQMEKRWNGTFSLIGKILSEKR